MLNMYVTSCHKREMLAVLAVSVWAATAHAQPLIVGNNAAFGGGPITTYDFATGDVVGTFVPTGAVSDSNNGRGLLVLGNRIYYTELSGGFGRTDSIRIAPFNGGAGGADIATLPSPRPETGIQDLAVSDGVIYVLTGYPSAPLEVFGLDPVSGAVVSGPVSIGRSANPSSDGFTVLANGNFLINDGDEICTYNQYDHSTGALVPDTTIVIPARSCTGVETNGASLFFQTNFSSLTETDPSGVVIKTQTVPPNLVEDISLVTLGCAGTPGEPNCHGRCVSSLAHTYGGIDNAASDLGYDSVADLQRAIRAFCGR